MENKEAEQVDD